MLHLLYALRVYPVWPLCVSLCFFLYGEGLYFVLRLFYSYLTHASPLPLPSQRGSIGKSYDATNNRVQSNIFTGSDFVEVLLDIGLSLRCPQLVLAAIRSSL